MSDCLFPVAEAEALVKNFMNCTLPKEDWTHEAHLIAGLYLLAHHGEVALQEMRYCLLRYNESVGGVNDDHHGYHETLTVFWLWAIQSVLAGDHSQLYWNQEALDDLLFDENLADPNCWQSYYSSERMMSVEARRRWVEPDLQEMD